MSSSTDHIALAEEMVEKCACGRTQPHSELTCLPKERIPAGAKSTQHGSEREEE